MKLSGGTPKLANQLNVEAFLDQARSYDEESATPLGYFLRNAQTRQLTHPLPVARAREIDLWSRSAEFKNLIQEGVFIAAPDDAREAQETASRVVSGNAAGRAISLNGSFDESEDLRSAATSYDEM